MFLQPSDYDLQIRADQLAQIIQTNPGVLDDAELTALEEIQGYLRASYNVTELFTAVGPARNRLLVTFSVDVALYHLHSAIVPRNIPPVRITRYESAINYFRNVQAGKITPSFPLLPPPTDESGAPIPNEQNFYIVSQKRNFWYY